MSVCRNSVIAWRATRPAGGPRATRRPPRRLRAAPGLPTVDDRVGGRGLVGQDDLGLAVLPLADEELAGRAAVVVPAELAEDRRHGVLAQPVGHLDLVL